MKVSGRYSPRRHRRVEVAKSLSEGNPGGKHLTLGSKAVGTTFLEQGRWVWRLNHGGLEVVAWGNGIRQARERRSVVGKDPPACAVGLEYRRCSSSDLW